MLCPQWPLYYTQDEGAAVSGAGSLRPRWSSFLPHKGENTSQGQVPPEKMTEPGFESNTHICQTSAFAH